jgi:hypothetical protein
VPVDVCGLVHAQLATLSNASTVFWAELQTTRQVTEAWQAGENHAVESSNEKAG